MNVQTQHKDRAREIVDAERAAAMRAPFSPTDLRNAEAQAAEARAAADALEQLEGPQDRLELAGAAVRARVAECEAELERHDPARDAFADAVQNARAALQELDAAAAVHGRGTLDAAEALELRNRLEVARAKERACRRALDAAKRAARKPTIALWTDYNEARKDTSELVDLFLRGGFTPRNELHRPAEDAAHFAYGTGEAARPEVAALWVLFENDALAQLEARAVELDVDPKQADAGALRDLFDIRWTRFRSRK